MTLQSNRRRGAAAVELAVSMIFLVPLIMYMFFLQDMLIMKLNGQEAAVQATWDFAVVNYGAAVRGESGDNGAWGISRRSRWTYCDHTSAYDSYQQGYDCNDQIHHKAMSAHECWIGNDGSYSGQVYCVFDGEPLNVQGQTAGAVAGFGQGGAVRCYSRLGIMNYYLPNKFLTTFRKSQGGGFGVNVDSKGVNKMRMESRWAYGNNGPAKNAQGQNRDQDDAHNDRTKVKASGETSAGSNYWRLARTEHKMLVDPWALTLEGGKSEIPDIDPTKPDTMDPQKNALYARISAAYDVHSAATQAGMQFGQSIAGDGLLDQSALSDGDGDDLTTAAGAFKKGDSEQKFGDFHAAQWGDDRIANERGTGYFGQ